jgi:hypothetical protein
MRESPSPQPRPGALKPEPVPPKALPRLELAGPWLRALRVRAGSLPVEAPQGYGYLGENRLFELLDKGLPGEEFLCLRNLLVLRHMDIDLVVIGPNGIWLLDSKYWSGWIRYHNGIWTRDRDLNEGEDHPDLKWAEQENRVRMTLNNNLGHLSIDWEKIIRGGLVFTHPEVNLQIIPLCPVEAGTVHLWVRWIRETEPAVGFDLETRLKAVDALCIRSQRLRKEENPDFQTVPAARIAETVYGAAVAEARRIVERG